MVKKRGIIWNYYNKKVDGTQVVAFCKFCDQSYIQNATRMEKHMERCPKCPEQIKQQFIQVVNCKRNKASIIGMKLAEAWPKLEAQEVQTTDAQEELEELDDWEYKREGYAEDMGESSDNIELVMHGEEEWAHQNAEPQNADIDINIEENSEDWNVKNSKNESPVVDVNHQRKIRHKYSEVSPSVQASNYSMLQSKIYQEQFLERRAMRKVAELEVRRKILELERLQWEFERDKAESEQRWNHEMHIMQIKEEREKQLFEQQQAQLSHVL